MMRARCPWYKTDMAPTLTGLPPHLVIITEMKNMETVMESIPSNLLETVHEELDRSMIGYKIHFNIREVEGKVEKMYKGVANHIEGFERHICCGGARHQGVGGGIVISVVGR